MKVSLFTVIFKSQPLEQFIPAIKKIGYAGVELMGNEPHLPSTLTSTRLKEIKNLFLSENLPVVCISTYAGGYTMLDDIRAQKQLDELKRFCSIAVELGCPLLRHNPGGPSVTRGEVQESHYARAVEWMRKALTIAEEFNCKLVMEIHHDSLTETVDSVLKLLKQVASDKLGVIYDPGNMYITGTEYGPRVIDLLRKYILHVHLKDEVRVSSQSFPDSFRERTAKGEEIFCPKLLGEGKVEFHTVLSGLFNWGYKGYLSVESHLNLDPLEIARREFKVVTEWIENLYQEE